MRGGKRGIAIPESDEVRRLISTRHWRSYDFFLLALIWSLMIVFVFLILSSRADAYEDVIRNISVEVHSHDRVTITWQTSVASIAQVRYGTTDKYGMVTPGRTYRNQHSFTIGDLEPGTTYHYQVFFRIPSRDEFSKDLNFTTNSLPPIEPFFAKYLRRDEQPGSIKVSEGSWISPAIFLLALILVLSLLYLYFFDRDKILHREEHAIKKPGSPEEMDEPLAPDHADYIKSNDTDFFIGSCLDKGMGLDDIKSTLEKSGYGLEGAYRRMVEFVLRRSYNNGYTMQETIEVMKRNGWDSDVVDACARRMFYQP